jgi:hypothetical protein
MVNHEGTVSVNTCFLRTYYWILCCVTSIRNGRACLIVNGRPLFNVDFNLFCIFQKKIILQ